MYFAPTANHSGGWVYLVYGGANRNYLTKPFIIAEGYDPSRIAPDLQSNYSIRNFLRDLRATNPNTSVSAFNLLGNDAPGTGAYDLVFIDYNNGTDDIRRNAALFEQVVQYVNAHKQGGTATGQKNVVMGESMGGLVARYGLARMEKAQPGSTHTRLLVTHDSPHRGANTPLGLQALTRQSASTYLAISIRLVNASGIPHFLSGGDIFPELEQADLLLDEPATKQLLLLRATVQRYLPYAFASSYGVEYNSFVDGDYRTMITPPAGGFPYRFIATSLGSQCGKETLAPYDELVRITGEAYRSALLVSSGIHTEIIVNALPNPGQVRRLSSLRVWIQTRVLIFSHKTYLSHLDYQSPSSNPVAWDGLPGGVQFIKGQINLQTGSRSAWRLYGPIVAGYAFDAALANTFCFVPSASALDIPVLDNSTTRASFVNGFTSSYSPPRAEAFLAETPFYNYSTGKTEYNYPHPSIPGRYGQWIYNEMERPFNGNTNSIACDASPECNPLPLIVGPSQVCPGAAATFQVNSAAITWTAKPSNFFTVTTGVGPQFNTSAVAGAQGTGTITATTPCGQTLTKTVALGTAIPTGTYRYNGSTYSLQGTNFLPYNTYLTIFMDPPYSFTFTSNNPGVVLSNSNGTSTSFSIPASVQSQVKITATATTSTGACELSGNYIFAGTYVPQRLTYAPNPVSTELTVTDPETDLTGVSTEPFEVELYDTYGKRVKVKKSEHNRAVLVLSQGSYLP